DLKMTPEDRLELQRGLSFEYATVKRQIPQSKKALEFRKDGTVDQSEWNKAQRENGTAARVGDIVQITKLEIEGDEIKMELNGGLKSGTKWYDRISVGVGGTGTTGGQRGPSGTPTMGSSITVKFPGGVPSM